MKDQNILIGQPIDFENYRIKDLVGRIKDINKNHQSAKRNW